jgi:hypothetical protein
MHALTRPYPLRGSLSLALSLALGALVAPGVHAAQPAVPQPSPFPLNQPMSFVYMDAQGTGSITLTDVGPDPATGGRELRVSILINGVHADGSGLTYLLADPPPALNNLITFTVVVPNGPALFYQGKMGGTAQFQGQGTFHTAADPTQLAGWSLVALPQVTLNRNYISFSSARLGQTAGPLCFTMTNPGPQPLFISNIGVQNCSSSIDPTYIDCATVAGFRIMPGGDAPGILGPGQSRDVCLTFTPGETATFDAHVLITTNASATPVDVQLHGTGDPR